MIPHFGEFVNKIWRKNKIFLLVLLTNAEKGIKIAGAPPENRSGSGARSCRADAAQGNRKELKLKRKPRKNERKPRKTEREPRRTSNGKTQAAQDGRIRSAEGRRIYALPKKCGGY